MSKILIVEDQRIVAKDLQAQLTDLGYQVVGSVGTGEEAISCLQSASPDVVLMDIMLDGKIDGIETANLIKRMAEVPVVYLTALSDDKTIARSRKSQPFGYLVKPFSTRELYATIEMAMTNHRIQVKMHKNEQMMRTILTCMGDALIATNEDGQIQYMNPVAEQMTGWSLQDGRGHNIHEILQLVEGKSRVPYERLLDAVKKAEGKVTLRPDVFLVSRNQKEYEISDSCTPLYDKNGRINGIVVIFQDITEKKKLENELTRAQKLDAVGTLAAGIAHDFNNLMTGMLGNISLARIDRDDVSRDRHLSAVEKIIARATDLTGQLLTFTKGGEPIKEVANIAELARETARLALMGSSSACELLIPDDLWNCYVDPGQIGQAFANTLINAVQSMRDGGVVKIVARNEFVETMNAIGLEPGEYVSVRISDDGVGIPHNNLEKVFDPYFTTRQDGHGLGLFIVYSIIKRHNGAIFVDSQVGKGTTFTMYLPATREAIESARAEVEETPAAAGGHFRILVMDDEEMIRDVLTIGLTNHGYEVMTAENGEQAIAILEDELKAGRNIDLLILDLTIPGGMGGVRCLEAVRNIKPDIKALVSSGYSQDPVMADPAAYGFNGSLKKPYVVKRMLNKIAAILAAPGRERIN